MSRNLPSADEIQPVLSAYALAIEPHEAQYLGAAGGFSGARFWRLKMPRGDCCLRAWPPEHPSVERLTLIHNVLRHAAARGIEFLPVPVPARSGQTFVEHAGKLWELAPWLAGTGDYSRNPNEQRLGAAFAALARFHLATADFPSHECRIAPSPRNAARRVDLDRWTGNELARLREAIRVGRICNPSVVAAIIDLFEQLAPRVAADLSAALNLDTTLQPAIRDVWANHFLFTGDAVTGLVDFGGLNIDSPATDIARVAGSMAGDDLAAWRTALAAYETVRPLTPPERQIIPIFDRSAVALSGMNWLRWLYLDGRTFANLSQIDERLSVIAARMKALFERQNADSHCRNA